MFRTEELKFEQAVIHGDRDGRVRKGRTKYNFIMWACGSGNAEGLRCICVGVMSFAGIGRRQHGVEVDNLLLSR